MFILLGALGPLIINWIENGMKEDVNNIINKVQLLLTGNISNYQQKTRSAVFRMGDRRIAAKKKE